MIQGWQSQSTDGLKGGWNFAFWGGYSVCSGHLVRSPHTQLLDVMWRGAAAVVVVM